MPPEPIQESEDLSQAYINRRRDREFEAASRRLELRAKRFQEAQQKEKGTEGPADYLSPEYRQEFNEAVVGGIKTSGKAALDVGYGLLEAPIQAPAGFFLDAANSLLQTFSDMADWLDENVADLGKVTYSPETGLQFTSAKRAKQMAQKMGLSKVAPVQIPVPAEADSTTGKYIRSISKFLGGFVGAGKFTGLKGAGTYTTKAVNALHGAISGGVVFDPHEDRLANLLNEVPVLKEIVPDYLNSDPTDSAADGRLKNFLEGLGFGLAAEGLGVALKTMRAGRVARTAAEAPASAEQVAQAPLRVVKPEEVEELLSDLPAPKGILKIPEAERPTPQEVVSAVKEGPPIVIDQGKVYTNWAHIDTGEDLQKAIRYLADEDRIAIINAQRGVQHWQDTILGAEKQDAWKILLERRRGEPLNDRKLFALRELWISSTSKAEQLAEKAVENPSLANQFAFRKAVSLQNMVQREFYGARTEVARAQQSMRIPAGGDLERTRQISALLESLGGDSVTQAMAEKVVLLSRSGSAKELDDFIATSFGARTRDAISAAWYFSLLSRVHTHMRNLLSNTAVAGQQIYERKAANLIGQMLGEENVVTGETMALLTGTLEGTKDALRITARGRRILREAGEVATQGSEGRQAARQMLRHGEEEFGSVYRSMATGESGIGIGKLETPTAGAFSSERWVLDPESGWGRTMDMLDSVVSSTGRALMAGDELFKTMGYRAELHAQVHRKVAGELARGDLENTAQVIKDRTARLLADPDETLRLAAFDAATYRTFTGEMGPWAKKISEAFNNPKISPQLRGLGIVLWPFRRTPSRIFNYGFERTPLAPLFTHIQEELAAGGARRDLALARMMTGSALLAAAMDLAIDGHITGQGPVNANQRATMRRMGIQANSVKVGDRYYSYIGTEPISQTLGIAANIVEILNNTDWQDQDEELERMLVAATMAVAYQTTSATYMQGLSDFFDAMGDPVRYGEHYFQKLAGTVVPGGVSQITQVIDPNMRAVHSMIDSIRRRTPVLSEGLPFQRDAWGRTISYESGLGTIYDIISPIYSKKMNASQIDKELNRLELWIGKPSMRASFTPDMVGVPGSGSVTVHLRRFPKAYDRYVELQGNALKATADGIPIDPTTGLGLFDNLNALVSGKHPLSALYDKGTDGPDGQRAQMIRDFRSKFMRAAREQLLLEFPDLREEVIRRMPREFF